MDTFDDPTVATVTEFAEQLRQYATHFALSDWDYTRDTGNLKHIRYVDDWRGYNHPARRLIRLVKNFGRPGSLEDMLGMRWFAWRHPLIQTRVTMRTDSHLPDGVLDHGSIITFWEETGEYLQYVQPSVGEMLADWMDAEPGNTHALKIAGEMRRINARYGQRIADDEVSS